LNEAQTKATVVVKAATVIQRCWRHYAARKAEAARWGIPLKPTRARPQASPVVTVSDQHGLKVLAAHKSTLQAARGSGAVHIGRMGPRAEQMMTQKQRASPRRKTLPPLPKRGSPRRARTFRSEISVIDDDGPKHTTPQLTARQFLLKQLQSQAMMSRVKACRGWNDDPVYQKKTDKFAHRRYPAEIRRTKILPALQSTPERQKKWVA